MPPLNGHARRTGSEGAEFLDFLIGASAADRKQLYKNGLDTLNAQAQKQFRNHSPTSDEAQAGELLAPLRAAWTYEPPADPFARFLREAKQDVRTATMNSREYATARSQAVGVVAAWGNIGIRLTKQKKTLTQRFKATKVTEGRLSRHTLRLCSFVPLW